MTTTSGCTRSHVGAAATFLEALASRDFDTFGGSLSPTATMTALVPKGMRECSNPAEIGSMFSKWFGDTTEFDLAEADLGEVGGRLHFRWLVRLAADRLGTGVFEVEQHAYVETSAGHITRIRILCSGYCPVRDGI